MMAGEGGEGVGKGRGPAGMAEGGPAAGASQRRDEAEDVALPRLFADLTISLAADIAKEMGDPVISPELSIELRLIYSIGYLAGAGRRP